MIDFLVFLFKNFTTYRFGWFNNQLLINGGGIENCSVIVFIIISIITIFNIIHYIANHTDNLIYWLLVLGYIVQNIISHILLALIFMSIAGGVGYIVGIVSYAIIGGMITGNQNDYYEKIYGYFKLLGWVKELAENCAIYIHTKDKYKRKYKQIINIKI